MPAEYIIIRKSNYQVRTIAKHEIPTLHNIYITCQLEVKVETARKLKSAKYMRFSRLMEIYL